MTRVLIASQAANTLGRSTNDHRPRQARQPEPQRPGLIRRSLTALTSRRTDRRATSATPPPAADQPAPEIAVAMRAER